MHSANESDIQTAESYTWPISQNLRKWLCAQLFPGGRKTQQAGRLWASSRAAAYLVCSLQAAVPWALALSFCRRVFKTLVECMGSNALGSRVVLLLPQPSHPAWALGDSCWKGGKYGQQCLVPLVHCHCQLLITCPVGNKRKGNCPRTCQDKDPFMEKLYRTEAKTICLLSTSSAERLRQA